jgi:hypothetical protein
MLAHALIRFHRLALLVALTVALVATGFAHHIPKPQDQALAFALAAGADPADFCGDLDDGGTGSHCPACQLIGAVDLPPASLSLIDLELALVAGVIAPRESRALARILDPARSPQGPPVA